VPKTQVPQVPNTRKGNMTNRNNKPISIVKNEIGSDSNTSSGTEPSHQRLKKCFINVIIKISKNSGTHERVTDITQETT
jgi:hypothetical protein